MTLHIHAKEDYIKKVAQKFHVSPDLVNAITYGEMQGIDDHLAFEIMREFVGESDQIFFAMIWKDTKIPGGITNIKDYEYIGQVVQGINLFLHKTPYIAQVFPVNSIIADVAYFRRLLSKRPNAGFIIILAGNVDNLQTVCHETHRPYLFLNYPSGLDIKGHYFVSVNTGDVTNEIVSHLYELGHRRIAFIHGHLSLQVGQDRLNQYNAAMDAVGLKVSQELVMKGNWRVIGGYSATQALLALEDKPTAIIAANDRMALGAMQAIKEHGLSIPDDISVVGFNDIAEAIQTTPPLATVRQPMTKIGSVAAEVMVALLEGDTPEPRHLYLPVEFIIRDSIGVPPRLS